jgi:hypothetical protein
MLILLETPAGFALFKLTNESKLKKLEDVYTYMENPENA